MLFHVWNTASQYRTTDLAKVLGVWLDRHLKSQSHVDQLKALNIFTSNNFKCLLNHANKPSSRFKLFIVYIRPRIDYSNFLWYNNNPSPLNGLCWNAVKFVISCKYNRFYKHVTSALLSFPSAQTIFFENVLRYLTSVACDRSLNLVIMDEHINVCRDFLRCLSCKLTRGNDGLKVFVNFVQARVERTSKL